MSSRHRSGRDRERDNYSRRRSRSPEYRRGKSPRRDDKDRYHSKSKSASSYQNNRSESRYRDEDRKRKEPSPTIKSTKEEESESPSKQPKTEVENIGEYQSKVEEQLLSMQKQESEEELLEKARKRRQAILDKYKSSSNVETVTKSPDKVINEISNANTTDSPQQPATTTNIDLPSPQSPTELFVNEPTSTSDSSFDMFSTSPSLDFGDLAKGLESKGTAAEIESDSQGYALLRPGELLGDRYQINAICGQGMFSRVLRARDNTDNSEVVIKVIRDNDYMKRVGAKEVEILMRINQEDPESKYGFVKLLHHFHDRDFMCLVFEPMLCNLRELVYKFGGKNGISLKAVQVFSKKLLFSLSLLRKLEVIHADIKPDNILVALNKNSVRLADLGSSIPKNEVAGFTGSIELVTGFYRAPEIILGLPITSDIDTWSLACSLYEMLTGKLLFKASNNNELLKKHIEVMGMAELPRKLIKKSPYHAEHFDDQFLFLARKTDPITNAIYSQAISLVNPSRNLKEELLDNASESELKHIPVFYDLLSRMLALDPSKRIKPEDALSHPFYSLQL